MSLSEMYAYYLGSLDAYDDSRCHWPILIKGSPVTRDEQEAYHKGRKEKELQNLWA